MKQCVVIMPFHEAFDSHFAIIKQSGEALGYEVYRVDTHRFSGNILEAIFKALAKADLVVADVSGNNPNVFYELAIAHSLGKKVLIVSNDRNAIPFDISANRIDFIDPANANTAATLQQSMAQLATSEFVTGPLGSDLLYGKNLFWRRCGALLLDIAPFASGFALAGLVLGWEQAASNDLVGGSFVFAALIYLTLGTWLFGSSIGKYVFSIKVEALEGGKPSFVQSLSRVALLYILPVLTYGISILWCLKGPGYRTAQDIATKTRVAQKVKQ